MWKSHRKSLCDAGYEITEFVEFAVDTGDEAKRIEDLIFEKFPINPQKVKGFITEATYYHMFDEVVEYIETLIKENK